MLKVISWPVVGGESEPCALIGSASEKVALFYPLGRLFCCNSDQMFHASTCLQDVRLNPTLLYKDRDEKDEEKDT